MKPFEIHTMYNMGLFFSWNWIYFINFILVGLLVVVCGIIGMVFNGKNFLITMLCIELTYLGTSFVLVMNSVYYSEPKSQIYSLILIITAAAEAAVGLGLLITIYRYEKRIDFPAFNCLYG